MRNERNRKLYECVDVVKVVSKEDELSMYELGLIYAHLESCEQSCEELVGKYLDDLKQEPVNKDHPL